MANLAKIARIVGFSLLVGGSVIAAQVPLTSQVPYGSTPAPYGAGRVWASVGWNVRLLQDKGGWSCTISSGPMVELVPNDKLNKSIVWQNQSYTYGALFTITADQTQLYAWHNGPAAPENPSALNVSVNVKQNGQFHFPIFQKYMNNGTLVMGAQVPRDVLFNVIIPDMENNEMFHLNIDRTAYGLGAMNFRLSVNQFRECMQWMDKYNAGK